MESPLRLGRGCSAERRAARLRRGQAARASPCPTPTRSTVRARADRAERRAGGAIHRCCSIPGGRRNRLAEVMNMLAGPPAAPLRVRVARLRPGQATPSPGMASLAERSFSVRGEALPAGGIAGKNFSLNGAARPGGRAAREMNRADPRCGAKPPWITTCTWWSAPASTSRRVLARATASGTSWPPIISDLAMSSTSSSRPTHHHAGAADFLRRVCRRGSPTLFAPPA